MKAWRVEKHGENLKHLEIPNPVCGPMQVRIRVQAVGLNHLDLWLQKGVPGHQFHLPMTPGGDIAGVITELGAGLEQNSLYSDLKVGTPVLVNPGVSCGHCEACLTGQDPLCRSYGIFGETQDGGCADEVIASVANVLVRPPGLSATDGASLGIAYLTAWNMLTRKAQLRAGESILIHAGGSGVSTAAIQMAKLLGAFVITTVGSDDKMEKARLLGADHVIHYKRTPFREEMKKVRKTCEVVMDHVGAETFKDSLKCLGWGGRLVTCGATSGSKVEIDLNLIFFKNISILGSTMGSKGDFLRIVQLVSTGKLRPAIDTVFPMSELPKAFELIASRKTFGKVVLQAD